MSARLVSSTCLAVRRGVVVAFVLGLGVMALTVEAPSAGALVLPAATLDGPGQDIVAFGGVAMAEDGTGGVVYLKRVEGVPHVFVSRYVEGHWMAPIRVDAEARFAASWPRIGAADGGELVVVWATPFATNDEHPVEELLGATLGPGASTFGPVMIVDRNIREGIGTSPDLVMSSTGQADVVYRVVEGEANKVTQVRALHTGDVIETVRVAHFDGGRWTNLGAINRNPAASMRPPTVANAPQIAIGPTNTGIVVWQEPEITGVARIYARRLFGSTLDYVLPVSATSVSGGAIEQDAEAPSVSFTRLGQAVVAYRQPGGVGSPLPGPRIFVNTLPDGESVNGSEFQGATIPEPNVPEGAGAAVGRPSISIDEKREVSLLYDANGTPTVLEGSDKGLFSTLSIGPAFVGSQLTPASEVLAASAANPEGGAVFAWPSATTAGAAAVAVREDFPGGAVQTGLLGGGAGGPIGELAIGRSGLGDGLVAFQQGPLGDAAIVAAQVTAPPEQFVITVPKGWVKPSRAEIAWEPAPSADGPITYTVVLDGHRQPTPAGASGLRLNPATLGSGVHHVQVLATDMFGASTLTAPSKLLIDDTPPAVRIRRADGGFAVSVNISDAESGVALSALSVSFGDGGRARGHRRFRHRYLHAGVYTIVVHVRDRLGNEGLVRRLVSVR
jgi:PKD domain